MSDKSTVNLSRRRVLGGLGAIGVASAGAALGTSAYFSDEESFTDNIVTAGELDLLVGYYSYWDQGMAGSGSVGGTANGNAVSAELTDVKPGDSGLIAFCPEIETNPAYLWLCGELVSNAENGMTEPEGEVDDTPNAGELAQNIHVEVSYCDVADDVGDGFDPGDVDHLQDVWEGSLADLLAAIRAGVPLDGDGDVPEGGAFYEPGDQACYGGRPTRPRTRACASTGRFRRPLAT
jgi:predicted ribosomally synthesized peptide with SipW-like signal peptide